METQNNTSVSFDERIAVVKYGLEASERKMTVENYLELVAPALPDAQHYLPPQTITPSEIQGMTLAQERNLRSFSCLLIRQASQILHLPIEACACAQSIFHRFYYVQSFQQQDPYISAQASLFLAAKLEENPKPYKNLISAFDIAFQQFQNQKNNLSDQVELIPLDLTSYHSLDIKEKLMDRERQIIKSLGFQLQQISKSVIHRHLVQLLSSEAQNHFEISKQMVQTSWNLSNISYLAPICVVGGSPQMIAFACFELSARMTGVKLDKKFYLTKKNKILNGGDSPQIISYLFKQYNYCLNKIYEMSVDVSTPSLSYFDLETFKKYSTLILNTTVQVGAKPQQNAEKSIVVQKDLKTEQLSSHKSNIEAEKNVINLDKRRDGFVTKTDKSRKSSHSRSQSPRDRKQRRNQNKKRRRSSSYDSYDSRKDNSRRRRGGRSRDRRSPSYSRSSSYSSSENSRSSYKNTSTRKNNNSRERYQKHRDDHYSKKRYERNSPNRHQSPTNKDYNDRYRREEQFQKEDQAQKSNQYKQNSRNHYQRNKDSPVDYTEGFERYNNRSGYREKRAEHDDYRYNKNKNHHSYYDRYR